MECTQLALIEEKVQQLKNIIYEDKITIPVWRTRTATYTAAVQYENYSDWSELQLGQKSNKCSSAK